MSNPVITNKNQLMPDFETNVNGILYSFRKHVHMGIVYYNVTNSNGQATILQSQGTWTFLHPEEVPEDLADIKNELIAAIEAKENT